MNIETIIAEVIKREGGFTNNPNDPGGPTNFGITQKTLSDWLGQPATEVDVQNLNYGDAKAIYMKKYYQDPGFAAVAVLSEKIAYELTDTGVNCGTATATIMLQRCLNAFNQGGTKYGDLLVDGDCGSLTLRALSEYLAWRTTDGEAVMVSAINCLQGERYIELAEKNVKFEEFVYGWIRNRIGDL